MIVNRRTGLGDFAAPKACGGGAMLLRVAEGDRPYHCVKPSGMGESGILTQVQFGCDPTSPGCTGGTDIGPQPWFCDLPAWLQSSTMITECKYRGLAVDQPAAPTLPPFIAPGQTPGDVIGATSSADIAARLKAAADQAAAQNAQIESQTSADAGGSGSGISPLLIGAAVIAGIAALSVLR